MSQSVRRAPVVVAGVVLAVGLPILHSARAQQMLPCDYGSQGSYGGDYAKVSDEGPYAIDDQEIVEFDGDVDGATIQLGLIRPKVPAGVKVPVIVNASPYFHPLQTMDLRACRPFLTENFVPHGYAVALIAIRGTGDSGGCMNLMGPDERADLDQAITWLGQQPWSNGAIGMIGKSYDGATQWEVAAFGNPYLKTIVPLSGVPDLFELMYGPGRVDWRGPGVLAGIYYAESAVFYAPGRSPEHTVEVTACPEYATGMAASMFSGATGEMDPLGYYKERRYKDDIVRNYRGSVYLVQGLQDWNVNPGQQYPWIWELEKKGVYVKHLLGQWGHSWPYDDGSRMDWADVLLPWFDRWLKGDRDASLGPRVEVEDSTERWRSAADWPDGKALTYWLNPEHDLSPEPSKDSASEFVATDPFHTQGGYTSSLPPEGFEDACVQPTCAYFETAKFKDEFHVAGLPELDLKVVPQGPGGQLSAYVYAASEDGFERLGWGQLDLRFPDGAKAPKQVTPGQEMRAQILFQPLDAVAPAGSRLLLVVSGGTGWNRLPSVPNYPVAILEGAKNSRLDLVEVDAKPGDFFKP